MYVNLAPAMIFPGGLDDKDSAHNVGNPGLIPGLGRSPGGGHGDPVQYSCLENSIDRGACLYSMGLQGVRHDWVTNTHNVNPGYVPKIIKHVYSLDILTKKSEI